MADEYKHKLPWKLKQCPLFSECLGGSLLKRIGSEDWFENRFIRAILEDTGWMEEHQKLLADANIKEVKNWDMIFSQLDSYTPYDYDLKIFDVLAEVRLILWARENSYTDIEKLIPIPCRPKSKPKTPDFLMKKGGETTLAEAKHFRARDFLPDFVEDRLKGLVWKTGCLTRFGIFIDTTDKYVTFFSEHASGANLGTERLSGMN